MSALDAALLPHTGQNWTFVLTDSRRAALTAILERAAIENGVR
jgi:hypothetical protein